VSYESGKMWFFGLEVFVFSQTAVMLVIFGGSMGYMFGSCALGLCIASGIVILSEVFYRR
jgi:hypothetical protein